MAAVAWVLNQVLVFSGDPLSGWSGAWLYLQGFIPAAAYALLTRIRVVFRRRESESRSHCDRIARRTVAMVAVVSAVAVFAARMTMIFVLTITEIDPMFFFVKMGWHGFLAFILGRSARECCSSWE